MAEIGNELGGASESIRSNAAMGGGGIESNAGGTLDLGRVPVWGPSSALAGNRAKIESLELFAGEVRVVFLLD